MAVASNAVLLEASLVFLGGLADPTAVRWGLDINGALAEPGIYFASAWLWWVLVVRPMLEVCDRGVRFAGEVDARRG